MSKRRPSFFIQDILTSISRIESYTSDLNFESFSKNFMAIEACLYNIQIIGEAVSNLPESLRENESQIPWNLMKSMRNRLIHEYFGTDLSLVWNVIAIELPAMKGELDRIVNVLIHKGE